MIDYDSRFHAFLSNCTLCPRECGVNRFRDNDGYCGTGAGLNIASVCIHKGEEPPISGKYGICNIFFYGCNLRCIYCQNHEISQPRRIIRSQYDDLNSLLDRVEDVLSSGVKALGFVSPSHLVPQVKQIINGVHGRGLHPVIVYNTNGYDKVETLMELDGLVDVWLPDFKYASASLSKEFSDAADYPEVALKALKEMYFQKGSRLLINEEGIAESGILIRHLVLPGYADNSREILRIIAEELSTGVNISLMSQYHPVYRAERHPVINRSLYAEEYQGVVEEMERLGFRNGWLQDRESNENYLPDFSREHPFE